MTERPGEMPGRAVLISGGLDSAILLAESLQGQEAVHPLYIRSGLFWESEELRHLRLFLAAMSGATLRPLQVLELPVTDLYGAHWSLTGRDVPNDASPDDEVFLPGRNLLLLAKSMLWCHLHKVGTLALGLLGSNPFPDATPSFFAGCQQTFNQAVGSQVQLLRPYAHLSKVDVLLRGQGFPLELTFSCIRPVAGKHCGICNKCAERRRAFMKAGLTDATVYVSEATPQNS